VETILAVPIKFLDRVAKVRVPIMITNAMLIVWVVVAHVDAVMVPNHTTMKRLANSKSVSDGDDEVCCREPKSFKRAAKIGDWM
jgi:hypothetical protein